MTKSIVQQEIDFYNAATGKNYRNVPDAKREYLRIQSVAKEQPEQKEDKPKPSVRKREKETE